MSALASEPLEVVAPMEAPTRARPELLRLVSTPRPRTRMDALYPRVA